MTNTSTNHYHNSRLIGRVYQPIHPFFSNARRGAKGTQSIDPNLVSQWMQPLLEKLDPEFIPEKTEKNSAAVVPGKLGREKGGKASAAKLSAKRRKEIAKKAPKA